MVDANQKALHATGYLLSQGNLIRRLLEKCARLETLEGFVLSGYRTIQIAIADLEEGAGYDFGTLRDADPLAKARAAKRHARPASPGSWWSATWTTSLCDRRRGA